MLDQNTDRMWYVIGAVIIGAALIFLMNGTFPTLFANVGETFEDKVSDTTEMTDGIMPGTKVTTPVQSDLTVSTFPLPAELLSYDAESRIWELRVGVNASGRSAGLSVSPGVMIVPWGYKYTVRYDVYTNEDTSTNNDVNNFYVGQIPGNLSSGNNNDNVLTRVSNGIQSDSDVDFSAQHDLKGGEWTTIEFSYINNSPKNVHQSALEDRSSFGARNSSDVPLDIKIKNVSLSLTKVE